MVDTIELEVVTPERRVVHEQVDEVVLPSVEGYLGVQPGHAPLLARLDVGEIAYRKGKEVRYLTTSGGFAEILRHSVCVLARTAEKAEEIDRERALRAKDSAERRLKPTGSDEDVGKAEVKLKRAISRIQVHSRLAG